jgi:hypothetical protein
MTLRITFAVAAALSIATPALAQDNSVAPASQQTSFPWGIIGAVGLIGLLGARKRAS